MTAAREPRRGAAISTTIAAPFADCERPSDVWCMDFKGWFHTHDSIKCYPFTLIDALSRILLRCVPPAAVHRRSTCHYPRGLLATSDTPGHTEHVDRRGWLRWRPRPVFLGEAFALERVSSAWRK
jgi:hypothetical protein